MQADIDDLEFVEPEEEDSDPLEMTQSANDVRYFVSPCHYG